jgi:hypothetical protein
MYSRLVKNNQRGKNYRRLTETAHTQRSFLDVKTGSTLAGNRFAKRDCRYTTPASGALDMPYKTLLVLTVTLLLSGHGRWNLVNAELHNQATSCWYCCCCSSVVGAAVVFVSLNRQPEAWTIQHFWCDMTCVTPRFHSIAVQAAVH